MERVSISTRTTRWLNPVASALLLLTFAPELRAIRPALALVPSQQQSQPSTADQLQQRALEEGEAGKTSEAIQDYKSALLLSPNWKEGRWNLGSLEYGAGRFEEARETFSKVVQFAPNLGMVWALLGLSEFEVKDYPNSLLHLQKAQSLGIQDDLEIARVSSYHLALLLIRSGQFEQAQSFLLTTFGSAPFTAQIEAAVGLAALRVPLLPSEIEPGQDALVSEVGEAVSAGKAGLSSLANLIKLHPDVPYLHYAYGLALAEDGQLDEAIAQLRAEVQVSPQSPLPWIELSRLKSGKPEESESFAKKAVALAPTSRETHEALAVAEKAAGNDARAQAERDAAQSLSPGSTVEDRIKQRYSGSRDSDLGAAQKSMQLAAQEYSSQQYAEASQHLREWIILHPQDGTALAMLGLSEFALKDYDNARIHLDRGAQLGLNGSPQSIRDAKYTFGLLLIQAGQFDRATDILVAANTGGAADSQIQYALGLALLRKPVLPGQNEADAKLFASAGEVSLLLQQSRYDEALLRFKQLVAQYPSTPFLHYAYGTALMALSEFDEAAAQMQAELALSPRSALPPLRLASIALRQHRAEGSIEWARRSLALAPQSVEAHYLLGRALLEQGNSNQAMQELEIASKLSPGSPEIHFNLAKAYDRAKLPLKAEQERQTFARLNAESEDKRSRQGSQIYSGPHDSGVISQPLTDSNPVTKGAPMAAPMH